MDLYKKKKSSGSPEDLEYQYGQTWIWTAIDAPTRLLITFWIGGRGLDDARLMLKDLTNRTLGKPLFVSDELPHYGTVLGELFHKTVPPVPTGKPGRPRKPELVIDNDLDYATVHKTRQGAQVVKVERKVVHGSEQNILSRLVQAPSHMINTAYVERSKLDWRLWDAHLAGAQGLQLFLGAITPIGFAFVQPLLNHFTIPIHAPSLVERAFIGGQS